MTPGYYPAGARTPARPPELQVLLWHSAHARTNGPGLITIALLSQTHGCLRLCPNLLL